MFISNPLKSATASVPRRVALPRIKPLLGSHFQCYVVVVSISLRELFHRWRPCLTECLLQPLLLAIESCVIPIWWRCWVLPPSLAQLIWLLSTASPQLYQACVNCQPLGWRCTKSWSSRSGRGRIRVWCKAAEAGWHYFCASNKGSA